MAKDANRADILIGQLDNAVTDLGHMLPLFPATSIAQVNATDRVTALLNAKPSLSTSEIVRGKVLAAFVLVL